MDRTMKSNKQNMDHFQSVTKAHRQKKKDAEKDAFAKDKNRREEEKHRDEKKRKDMAKAQTHGSYQVQQIQGVSLAPSMANVKVKIHYVGGPADKMTGERDHDYQEISVGAKVLPSEIVNFQNIQDAILDDYFANRMEMFFRTQYRKSLRTMFKIVERVIKRLSGMHVDMAKMIKDPVKRMILLSPQGFVNAAAFKKNKNTPSFYNFTSASVVFLHDDMTYDGAENFFKNKSQMQKMFKAGWNTFIVMNDIEEKVYFISSLDGGALHILPYSYIFNSLKMDKVYDSDEFKRRARGFQVRSGGISTLISRLNRESKLVQSVRKVITG
jgi:hypothetical protein